MLAILANAVCDLQWNCLSDYGDCPASDRYADRALILRRTLERTPMPITYDQAVAKLHEWTDSPALRCHARAVEAAMRLASHRYGGER